MNLLLFYFSQIFGHFHLPLAADICSAADSIQSYCSISINFLLLYICFLFAAAVLLILKRKYDWLKVAAFSPASMVLCFYFVDRSMIQLQDPAKFGIEWFVISYYLWAFILSNIFIVIILGGNARKLFTAALGYSLLSIALFSYTGRGNFEQVTIIAGGLFAGISWHFLFLSSSFLVACLLSALAMFGGFISLIKNWIITGNVTLKYFGRNILLLSLFVMLVILPVTSIFLGEALNNHDAKVAKAYIDNLKVKTDKYYYENGEYPKFIEKMLPDGKSPKLLARHEFFTMGVRGTYYFSRSDKYCFIFQNPTRHFGYYSMTSERGWRFSESSGSYDDVFINMCDESMSSYEDLISGHLDVSADDEMINTLTGATGQKVNPPVTNRASQILEQKIMEEGEKDPELMKYFKAPAEKEEKK